MVGMVTVALAAGSLAGSYDCTIDRQAVINEEGASNQPVMFPDSDRDAWRFALRITRGAAPSVNIAWPADPIQIAGNHRSLTLAPEHVALVATAAGPCMFTEQACATLVELSARDDGSVGFSILPAGLSRDEATGRRSLLHVVFIGTCRRRGGGE